MSLLAPYDVEPSLYWADADVGCDDEVRELHRLLPLRSKTDSQGETRLCRGTRSPQRTSAQHGC